MAPTVPIWRRLTRLARESCLVISSPAKPTASGLMPRVLTAAVLIPLLIGTLWLGSLRLTALVFGGFMAIGAFEWTTLMRWQGVARVAFMTAVFALCAAGAVVFRLPQCALPIFGGALLGWVGIALVLVGAQRGRNFLPSGDLVWAMLGLVALVPAYLALLWLQATDRSLLVGVFVLIWTADTAAYFAGRAWGVRRLADRISPGKTWAGALAALLLAPWAGLAVNLIAGTSPLSPLAMIGVGSLVVVASIIGDLFESLVKRRGGFKDSGSLLPGHGGVLDRIDSLLAAAPVYVATLIFMANTR